jgi:hypothetical protein
VASFGGLESSTAGGLRITSLVLRTVIFYVGNHHDVLEIKKEIRFPVNVDAQ